MSALGVLEEKKCVGKREKSESVLFSSERKKRGKREKQPTYEEEKGRMRGKGKAPLRIEHVLRETGKKKKKKNLSPSRLKEKGKKGKKYEACGTAE